MAHRTLHRSRSRSARLLALGLLLGGGLLGCDTAEDGVLVSANLWNDAAEDIHIFPTPEGFSPENRVASGAFRNVQFDGVSRGDRFAFSAGRNGQVLHSRNCVWNGNSLVSPSRVEVRWTGAELRCVDWPDE